MTTATLTVQGMNQISGDVVAGIDYALFQAPMTLEGTPVQGSHEAHLIIDGEIKRAVVENYQTTNHDGCEITLRMIRVGRPAITKARPAEDRPLVYPASGMLAHLASYASRQTRRFLAVGSLRQ